MRVQSLAGGHVHSTSPDPDNTSALTSPDATAWDVVMTITPLATSSNGVVTEGVTEAVSTRSGRTVPELRSKRQTPEGLETTRRSSPRSNPAAGVSVPAGTPVIAANPVPNPG